MPQRDDNDADLFRTAVGEVKPLKSDTAPRSRKRPEAKARFRRADEHQVLKESLGEDRQPSDLETGEELAYRRAGVAESVCVIVVPLRLRSGATIVISASSVSVSARRRKPSAR